MIKTPGRSEFQERIRREKKQQQQQQQKKKYKEEKNKKKKMGDKYNRMTMEERDGEETKKATTMLQNTPPFTPIKEIQETQQERKDNLREKNNKEEEKDKPYGYKRRIKRQTPPSPTMPMIQDPMPTFTEPEEWKIKRKRTRKEARLMELTGKRRIMSSQEGRQFEEEETGEEEEERVREAERMEKYAAKKKKLNIIFETGYTAAASTSKTRSTKNNKEDQRMIVSDGNTVMQKYALTLQATNFATCGVHMAFTENIDYLAGDILSYLTTDQAELKIADFATATQIHHYHKMKEDMVNVRITPRDTASLSVLSYLKGLLARKDEVAIVPLPNHMQLLLFSDDTALDYEPILSGYILKRFNIIFDLDQTLVRTRTAVNREDRPRPGEHEIFVRGTRLFCIIRPQTAQVLQWAHHLFRVYIFTNAVFDYAVEIAKLLDPQREHLCAGQPTTKLGQRRFFSQFIVARELLLTMPHKKKGMVKGMHERNVFKTQHALVFGEKDIHIMGLDEFETVILDDDRDVWLQKQNVLPFHRITQCQNRFFIVFRDAVWRQLKELADARAQIPLKSLPKSCHRVSFSQDFAMQAYNQFDQKDDTKAQVNVIISV